MRRIRPGSSGATRRSVCQRCDSIWSCSLSARGRARSWQRLLDVDRNGRGASERARPQRCLRRAVSKAVPPPVRHRTRAETRAGVAARVLQRAPDQRQRAVSRFDAHGEDRLRLPPSVPCASCRVCGSGYCVCACARHLPAGWLCWLLEKDLHWTEQYLLLALLEGNPNFRMLFGSRSHHLYNRTELEALIGRADRGGGSFWFEMARPQAR